jgi:hypothetical protein
LKNVVFWDIKTQFLLKEETHYVSASETALKCYFRFEVLTTLTMRNAVILEVAPFGLCNSRRFGGIIASITTAKTISEI